MVNLRKFETVLKIEDLSINVENWNTDYDTGKKKQILYTFINGNNNFTFMDFFQLITGLDSFSDVPLEYVWYSDFYNPDLDIPTFNSYTDYLRTQGLSDFEANNNVTCSINYDDNDSIVLYATLNGIKDITVDYICLDCLCYGSPETRSYSYDEALKNLECCSCNSDNLIFKGDMEEKGISVVYCERCDEESYYFTKDGIEECSNCGHDKFLID